MVKLTIRLHPSIRIDGQPWLFSGDFENISVIEAINILVEAHPSIAELCIQDGKRKPGMLYIADKTELASLGLLQEKISEDLEIHLVPILHGG